MTRDELLNIKDLDAVLVETRVADLLNTAEVCIAAGKHIHLDKPAGDNLTQYKRILDNAKKQNLLTQMGFMYRYNPAVVLLRDFLKKGWLGDIFEVHTVMSKVVSTPERKQLAKFKGGIMFELGCHITDLVIGVLGKPTKVEGFNQHASAIDDGLMDNMLAVLTYPKAIASIKTSAMEVEGGSRRHLVVCGSEGTFEIEPLDNPSVKLSLSKPRGEYKKGTQVIKFQGFNRYVADAADMVRIIRGEKPSDFSYDHDFAVQETLLQACKVL
jgi:predicted dehydrogenase